MPSNDIMCDVTDDIGNDVTDDKYKGRLWKVIEYTGRSIRKTVTKTVTIQKAMECHGKSWKVWKAVTKEVMKEVTKRLVTVTVTFFPI